MSCVLVLLGCLVGIAAGASDPIVAVHGLIDRVLPESSSQFSLVLIPQQGGVDVMQLASEQGGVIILRGSSAIALASAFNWYLNDYCNTTYDWNTYTPIMPSPLPLPPSGGSEIRPRLAKWNYYMNVCTMGYSLAFVSWDYWVKHIDWMAMNGINLPLAFVGQEAVVAQLFIQYYNLTWTDMQGFISGPAFLPWYRMGNIQGWGGPIPLTWVQQRYQLQLKILARMRELGMTPVLSAFAGHIPSAFVHAHPSANVTRSPDWCGFPDPYGSVYLLEPTDPYFHEIGSRYIALQAEMFGTDHIYNCDTYNEVDPRSRDPQYLASSSRAVYTAMTASDPDAIWLMQGWLFRYAGGFWQPQQIQAYLGAVPDDRLWLLDLSANDYPIWSRTNSFYGKPFIWCNLLNSGGQQGLNGNLSAIYDGIADAQGSTMIGFGITMEGIWQNYPAFEYTLRFAWDNSTPVNYITSYAARRYGPVITSDIVDAWKDLLAVAYLGGGSFGSLITQYPVMQPSPPAWLQRLQSRGEVTKEMMHAYYLSHNRVAATPAPTTLGATDSCAYGKLAGTYLAGYPFGYNPSNPPYDASQLSLALAWCQAQDALCGGVTLSSGRYEARAGWNALQSPFGETSWLKQCENPLLSAWRGLLSGRAYLQEVPSYSFDLVDVTRQVLSGNFSTLVARYRATVAQGKSALPQAEAIAQAMLDLLADYDAILSSDSNFMLGPFIDSARLWGVTDAERDLMEFNARNQLTLWGPTSGILNDYAAKSWGGLVRGYYTQRWQLFLNMSLTDLEQGKEFVQAAYDARCYPEIEQPFQQNRSRFPVIPEHDSVELAAALFQKYIGPL